MAGNRLLNPKSDFLLFENLQQLNPPKCNCLKIKFYQSEFCCCIATKLLSLQVGRFAWFKLSAKTLNTAISTSVISVRWDATSHFLSSVNLF